MGDPSPIQSSPPHPSLTPLLLPEAAAPTLPAHPSTFSQVSRGYLDCSCGWVGVANGVAKEGEGVFPKEGLGTAHAMTFSLIDGWTPSTQMGTLQNQVS